MIERTGVRTEVVYEVWYCNTSSHDKMDLRAEDFDSIYSHSGSHFILI